MRKLVELATQIDWRLYFEWGLIVFLVLYALFGLAEVVKNVREVIASFRDRKAKRKLTDFPIYALRILVSVGPLYITLEMIERLGDHA